MRDVDYDNPKDVVRRVRATMQTTLIPPKGNRETGRSAGETALDARSTLLVPAN